MPRPTTDRLGACRQLDDGAADHGLLSILVPRLQRRYRGYFSSYLEDKIRQAKR